MTFDTLRSFLLEFVLTPAGAGAILYFVLGSAPGIKDWFTALDAKVKELVVMLAAFGIPLAGMGIAMAFGYLPLTEDAVFNALQVGFLAFSGNQVIRAVKRMVT